MLNNQITVATLPLDIVYGDRERNINVVADTLSRMPAGIDIVVLPELFSTGFVHDIDSLAMMGETANGSTMTAVHKLAATHNVAIAGSFLCNIGGLYYNRAFFVEPSGDEMFYDKRHLFSLSPETRMYRAGEHRCQVIRFRGWNISMIVCYDLRFPVWCRNAGLCYDMLLVPANWPSAREYAWKHLLIARAIENQACVVGANRSGKDEYGVYDNLSYIFDALGMPVGTMDTGTGMTVATFVKNDLEQLRQRMPFGADADPHTICQL